MLYNPPHFQTHDAELLYAAIEAHGLATLVSNGADSPLISHLPLVLDRTRGPAGRLIGHVARANPHWQSVDVSIPSVVIFALADTYVSPEWYETKKMTGKVVPTWNFAVIHATGTLVIHDDPVWTRDAVERLTRRYEASRSTPWAVSDAPERYIEAQLRGIVGVELVIERLEGKYKLSQNRSEEDRQGVIQGLGAQQGAGSRKIHEMMQKIPEK